MTDHRSNLDTLVDATERLGVIGSPSSTSQLALDILGSAVSRKLVGELALFRFVQDSSPHYALGQITEVQLRNIRPQWHFGSKEPWGLCTRHLADHSSIRTDLRSALGRGFRAFGSRWPGLASRNELQRLE